MFFDRTFPKLLTVKAQEEAEEEELQDPQQILRDQCRETDHCKHLAEKYEACNERVRSKSRTTETCTEELFDFLHALDHCVTKDLFSKLK
ncbi:cytochrome b-c1 complex subunit 6, mitochondrial-like [Anoplophora glabripennis]|uniref:cytochrome b-c1 complex subunit 6, mitochondrial-like n=1 Tax=Anoplophora glabripennis TaxID=217634 RepID=UPI000873AFD2|nr:cytochrome b-c1 complex subunit 6, mitochondrial-like [Anoplophora glabripennis]